MASMRGIFLALLGVASVAACQEPTTVENAQTTDTTLQHLSSMAVGDVRVLTFEQVQKGLTIPASPASAQYALVVANVAGDTGSVAQYTVLGNLGAPATVSKAGGGVARQLFRPIYTVAGGERGRLFEAGLRSYERRHLRLSTPRVSRSAPTVLADRVPAGVVPAVGSQYQFNVPTGADPCAQYTTVTATVEAVTTEAIIMADTASPANGFTTADYDAVGSEFDTYMYPTEASYYGAPTDVDRNGHVFILYTPAVNKLTPPGTADSQGYVAGFTFAGDFFPATPEAQGGCPESNGGEIFYLMTPDPAGEFGNSFPAALVRETTRSTMAHELQHAINAGNRYVNNAPALETAWLDEALSSMAEDDVGRVELGLGDLQTITLNDVLAMDTTMFNTFFGENFVRTQMYVLRPDTVGPVVSDTREEADLAAFGAGWAFLRYVADWYSNDAPRTLTRKLVAGPDTGITNLTVSTGAPLDSLLSHWLVTMYTDGMGISGLPAEYSYRTYDLRDIVSQMCPNSSCTGPTYLPVNTLPDGTSISVGVPSTSADYFIATAGSGTITIQNADGSAATDPYGRVYIVRTQ